MKQIELEFSFKGDRNYVHGTDIYKEIVKNLDALGYNNWQYFELNIRKITHHNMTCFLTDKKQNQEGEVVSFILEKDTNRIFGSIIENTDKLIESNYSFNENEINKYCIIDYEHETITYTNPQNTFTTIDVVISMSKLYLENAVDRSVKWFFRTVKFLRPIDEIETQQIWMKKTVQKHRIIGFDVYVGNELIGYAFGASVS